MGSLPCETEDVVESWGIRSRPRCYVDSRAASGASEDEQAVQLLCYRSFLPVRGEPRLN